MNKHFPQLSIIVPVYNQELYLKRCVDSILGQTITDFELILIDDGSYDSSPKICDDYALMDNRIIVLHKKNEGVSSARNLGLNISKGDYIGFVDSDDFIHPQMYEILLGVASKTISGIISCDFSYVNCDDTVEYNHVNLDEVIISSHTYCKSEIYHDFYKLYLGPLHSFVFRRIYKKDIFKELRFNVDYQCCEDFLILLPSIEKSDYVTIINEKLYYYYLSKNSITRGAYSPKLYTGIPAIQNCIEFLRKKQEYDQAYLFEKRYICQFVDLYYKTKNEHSKYIKKLQPYYKNFVNNIACYIKNPFLVNIQKIMLILFWINPSFSELLHNYLSQYSLEDEIPSISEMLIKKIRKIMWI